MNRDFFGRAHERKQIQAATQSQRAELGIVYGRRRIGKSTVLKSLLGEQGRKDFYFEGLQKATKKKQIEHFLTQLSEQTESPPLLAASWHDAFIALTTFIKSGYHYVVFDELPWMANENEELVSLIKYFWDNKWKQNSGITLILCGSIASFMIKHVVHSSALHNRKTFEIKLEALSAQESLGFFHQRRSLNEVAKYLMIFGGIPKYLEQINPNESFHLNLDRLCFMRNGFFVTEFDTVFKEQFHKNKNYGKIVKRLAQAPLNQQNLAKAIDVPSGGGLNTYIENLQNADFIRTLQSFRLGKSLENNKAKTNKIVLWDEWLRFYFKYIKKNEQLIQSNSRLGLSQSILSKSIDGYFGLAFERLCYKNLQIILDAISCDFFDVLQWAPYFKQGVRGSSSQSSGTQIDLIVERKGNTLIVFEFKFSDNPQGLKVVHEVKNKIKILAPPKNYSVEKVLIATGGVTAEVENSNFFNKILGIESIFPNFPVK